MISYKIYRAKRIEETNYLSDVIYRRTTETTNTHKERNHFHSLISLVSLLSFSFTWYRLIVIASGLGVGGSIKCFGKEEL